MPVSDLPFVDEHELTTHAVADDTWAAVERYANAMAHSRRRVLSRVLGTEPASGFEIVGRQPRHEIALAGRHRFATYRLVFRVAPDGGRARIVADTFAVFPGLRGRLYRTLLLHTRGHQMATRLMLHRIRSLAERPYPAR